MNISDVILVKIKNHTYIIHKNYIYAVSVALGISSGYCFAVVIRKLLNEVETRFYRKISRKIRKRIFSKTRGGTVTPREAFEKCLETSDVFESIDSKLNKLISAMLNKKVTDGVIIISKEVYILAKILAAKKIVNIHALGLEIKADNLPAMVQTSKDLLIKTFNTGAMIASVAVQGIKVFIIVTVLISALNTGLEISLRHQCSREVIPYERVQPAGDNIIYLDPQVSRDSRVIITDHEELVVVQNDNKKPLSKSVEITQSENGFSININTDNLSSVSSTMKTQTVEDVQKNDDTESRREAKAIVKSRKSKPKKKVPLSERTQTLEGLKKKIAEKEAQDLNEQQDEIIDDDFIERVWNNLDE